MIPTIIIVSDDNPELKKFEELFTNFARVLKRTSLQGEQLYGMFEGIIYIGPEGNYDLKRRDNYEGVVELVLSKLVRLNESVSNQLKDYLSQRNDQDPRTRIHFLDGFEDGKIPDSFEHDSEVFNFMEMYFVE